MILIITDVNGIRTDIDTETASFHAHKNNGDNPIRLNAAHLILSKEFNCIRNGNINWSPNKRSAVAIQLSTMNVGDIKEVDYGKRLDTFRMTISTWSREVGKSFKTKVNLHDELIVKRIK